MLSLAPKLLTFIAINKGLFYHHGPPIDRIELLRFPSTISHIAAPRTWCSRHTENMAGKEVV